MALWDFLNQSDNNNSLSFGGSDYNPSQSNVLGQSLAPKTPTGDLPSVDPANDTRSQDQFKRDAQLFNREAKNSADEDDNYITSRNGNRYEKVDSSPLQQGLTAAASYMEAYFSSGGNVGQGAHAAGAATYALQAKADRLAQADHMEDLGANPLDVQAWINSGDKKDLFTNKGEFSA
ncbi:hypothetical protein, partial [Herbiconiux daphne]